MRQTPIVHTTVTDSWVLYGQVGVYMGKSAARKSQLLEVKHSKGLAMESVQKEPVRKRALPSVCSTECADSDKTGFSARGESHAVFRQ